MTSLILRFLLLAFAGRQAIELYDVVHVRGMVIDGASGRPLGLHNRLTADNQLLFRSPGAKVIVYRPGAGRFMLSLTAGFQGERAYVHQVMYRLETGKPFVPRNENERIRDLSSVFAAPRFVFIGDTTRLLLSTARYPLSNRRFFVYRYSAAGKTYNKKLGFKGDTLYFVRSELHPSAAPAGEEGAGQAELFHYDAASNSSDKVAGFAPVFVPDSALYAECQNLLRLLERDKAGQPPAAELLYDHVNAVYGHTDAGTFRQWLARYFPAVK